MSPQENTERVVRHTPPPYNERIYQAIEASIAYHREHPQEIPARLRELEREWDIERTLEANAATLVLAGSLLALFSSRRFLAVPLVVGSFLLQHAVQGWCPPLPVMRRLGVRTQAEILREREALEALRPLPE